MRNHRQRLTVLETFMQTMPFAVFVFLALLAAFALGWNWFFVNIEDLVR